MRFFCENKERSYLKTASKTIVVNFDLGCLMVLRDHTPKHVKEFWRGREFLVQNNEHTETVPIQGSNLVQSDIYF